MEDFSALRGSQAGMMWIGEHGNRIACVRE